MGIYFWQRVDIVPAGGHHARMRTRVPITAEQIVRALNAADGDLKVAVALVNAETGWPVSERTLRRRMADYGIKPTVRYQVKAA